MASWALLRDFPQLPASAVSQALASCHFSVAQAMTELFKERDDLTALQPLLSRVQTAFPSPDNIVWSAAVSLVSRRASIAASVPKVPPCFPVGLLCPVLLRPNHDAVALCVASLAARPGSASVRC